MKRKTGKAKVNPQKKRQKVSTNSANPADVILDPDGDLILRITQPDGDEISTYLVSRSALCLSSKVFRAMLGKKSQFREAASTGTDEIATVDLEDNNLRAALIILEIIHLKGTAAPAEIDLDLLYELAVLCDKYDLCLALGPWPRVWSQRHLPPYETPGDPRLLFIAWAFKLREQCQKTVASFIQHTRVGTNKQLYSDHGTLLGDEVPESIKAEILQRRGEAMGDIEQAIWQARCDLIEADNNCMAPNLFDPDTGQPAGYPAGTGKFLCRMLQRGAFVTAFPNAMFNAESSLFGDDMTIREISQLLFFLDADTLQGHCHLVYKTHHRKCDRLKVLKARIIEIMQSHIPEIPAQE